MSDLDCYKLPHYARQWLLNAKIEQSAVKLGKELVELGYTHRTIVSYLSAISHLAHWADTEELPVVHIDKVAIERFLRIHLPSCRCAPRCQRSVNTVRAAALCWQRFVHSSDLAPQDPDKLTSVICCELAAFKHHLIEVRGLQLITCDSRVHHVSDFLTEQFACRPIAIEQLKPVDIRGYIKERTQGWKPGSIKVVCGALSSYLRFKAIQGESTTKLIAALPKVAQWRQVSLPKALSSEEIDTLLDTFDQSTLGGKRDYAIARCYVDLGLRTTEVVRLELDDINWRHAIVHIRSKGARVDALPLPRATGEAIARYLEYRDKEHVTRTLFLRLNAPFDRAVTATTIRGSIRNAARRCGLSSRLTGPHKLRHTMAIRLVNAGVSLKQISDLMRHQDLDTTTIYAKADMNALSAVTSAWPEKHS